MEIIESNTQNNNSSEQLIYEKPLLTKIGDISMITQASVGSATDGCYFGCGNHSDSALGDLAD